MGDEVVVKVKNVSFKLCMIRVLGGDGMSMNCAVDKSPNLS